MLHRFCPTKWWPFAFPQKVTFEIFRVVDFQDVSTAVTVSSYWVSDNAAKVCHLWLILWRNLWCLDCVWPAVNDKCPLLSVSVGLGGPSACTLFPLANTWGWCHEELFNQWLFYTAAYQSSFQSPWSMCILHCGWCMQCCQMTMAYTFLCRFLVTVEAPRPVEHSAACKCFLSTMADNR